MKATVEVIGAVEIQGKNWVALVSDLVKARLTSLVLLTTLVGFYMGSQGTTQGWMMLHTLLATALLAGGAAALNQFLEREHDAKMRRTASRPIPSGQMKADTALIIGGLMSAAGLVYLSLAVNLLTGALGAATLASDLFIYTPLKRKTTLNTIIGAIPGALPPLMGWTAARGEITVEGWSLFAILFFWQLPHFLAISWIYREEYGKAGFVMLSVRDPDGRRTAHQAVSHTLGLVALSLYPFLARLAGPVYLAGALLMGICFFWAAWQFSRKLTIPAARQLFLVSILYLPLLLGLLVWDKIKL